MPVDQLNNLALQPTLPPRLHNGHEPLTEAQIEAVGVRHRLQDVAARSLDNTQRVLMQELSQVPRDVRRAVGEQRGVEQMMRRKRRANRPPAPGDLDFNIHQNPGFTRTVDGGDFVLGDSGRTLLDRRWILFGSEDTLVFLGQSCIRWYVDATFKRAPRHFKQLLTIRGENADKETVTCAYACLTHKDRAMYDEVLTSLVTNMTFIGCLDSQRRVEIMTDFETALRDALMLALGADEDDFSYCFFHLRKSSLRRIAKLGLKGRYKNSRSTRRFLSKFDALAFLPPQHVEEAFELLKAKASPGDRKLQAFIQYKERSYIGQRRWRRVPGTNIRLPAGRKTPKYPITTWNQHNSTMRGRGTTNNICEGWNSKLNRMIRAHPSIFELVDLLRKDNMLEEDHIARIRSRNYLPRRRENKNQMRRDRLIRQTLDNHVNGRQSHEIRFSRVLTDLATFLS